MIIRSAMREFLDKGYANATMAGIAERASLAKGTAYRYFDTKEDLFAGIVRDIVTNPLGEIENFPIRPDERVSDYCKRTMIPVMRTIEDKGRATVARLVLAEGHAFPYLTEVYRTEVYEPFLERICWLIDVAEERGELKGTILKTYPHLLTAPVWMGIVHNGLLGQDNLIDTATMFEAQVDLLFI
ncbi:TetR/AcrR family transcriptional regulator [Ochrobactrum sp. 19YEA23]|uniref:TetR/AcrR family transcriptional regulator n=1 Tax=Ochrobactrum sp. 19YEA23 TaxID=3039854 RepID=UPI00247AB73D